MIVRAYFEIWPNGINLPIVVDAKVVVATFYQVAAQPNIAQRLVGKRCIAAAVTYCNVS